MNTRLQVEHPVTELVTGVDLVHAQLRVAGGEPLPWTQQELSQRGHAIECRIYAEDPAQGFLPQAGPLLMYREPRGPGIRVDAGVREGGEVSVFYDPMLAKLIVSAETRDAAIARAMSALQQYVVLGIRTNIPFLIAILRHPRFPGRPDRHRVPRRREATALGAALVAEMPARSVCRGRRHDACSGCGRRSRGNPHTRRVGQDPFDTLRGWGLRDGAHRPPRRHSRLSHYTARRRASRSTTRGSRSSHRSRPLPCLDRRAALDGRRGGPGREPVDRIDGHTAVLEVSDEAGPRPHAAPHREPRADGADAGDGHEAARRARTRRSSAATCWSCSRR